MPWLLAKDTDGQTEKRKREKMCRTERWEETRSLRNTNTLILGIPCPVINGRSCCWYPVLGFYDKNSYYTYRPISSLNPSFLHCCSLRPSVFQANTWRDSPLSSAFSLHSFSVGDLMQTQAFIMYKYWWHTCSTERHTRTCECQHNISTWISHRSLDPNTFSSNNLFLSTTL